MKKCCLPVSTVKLYCGTPSMGQKQVKSPIGYSDRSLMGVNPLKEQFTPTEGDLLPQRAKMGGMT